MARGNQTMNTQQWPGIRREGNGGDRADQSTENSPARTTWPRWLNWTATAWMTVLADHLID
jgi:hypothetical protein